MTRQVAPGRRRGRPRKAGPRYPSGDLRRPRRGGSRQATAEPISPALWQRIVQYGRDLGVDERLSSEIGRLNRFGELTTAQTAALLRVGEIYGRYERAVGMPRRTVRGASYEVGYGDPTLADDILTPEARERRDRAVLAARQAYAALVGHRAADGTWISGLIPRHLREAVETLAVDDRPVLPTWYPDLRDLADRLAAAWHMSGAAPRGRSRAAMLTTQQRLRRAHASPSSASPSSSSPSPSAAVPGRTDWRSAISATISRLRPDLASEAVASLVAYCEALRDRIAFRRAKAGRQRK